MNSKCPSVFIRRPWRVYTGIKDNGVLIRTAKALANINTNCSSLGVVVYANSEALVCTCTYEHQNPLCFNMDSKDHGVFIRNQRPWSFNMNSKGPGVYIRTSKAMEF